MAFVGFEGLDAEEIHAIGGAGAGDDDEAGDVAGSGYAGALRGDEVVGLGGGAHADGVDEDVGELLEEIGDLAEAGLPGGAVDVEGRRCGKDGAGAAGLGGFGAEVAGDVFFLGADLLLGFDFEEAVECPAVTAVGGVPEAAGESGAVVGDGERDTGEGGVAVVAVGVVLGGGADADLDVGHAAAGFGGGSDGSVLGCDANAVGVRDGVADEVGLGLSGGVGGGAEGGHGAMALGVHGLEEDTVGGWLGGGRGGDGMG